LSVHEIRGSLTPDGNPTVQACFDQIGLLFHPASKVIVYGFSAGAYNALELCRKLDSMRFNYQTGALEGGAGQPDRPRLVVDLLVMVDPVKNELPLSVQATRTWSLVVPPCVRYGLNYYQDEIQDEGHGRPVMDARIDTGVVAKTTRGHERFCKELGDSGGRACPSESARPAAAWRRLGF
jgi:hypothetical protein